MLKAFFASREWAVWAWAGLLVILGGTWFSVHVSVLINKWNGRFWNLLAKATRKDGDVPASELFGAMTEFAQIAGVAVVVSVLLDFFTSHWTFRWRTALTNSYVGRWEELRHIEGASQRIQEDTMRFASTVELLGQNFVRSILSLIAFLPLLTELSENVTEIPFCGHVPHALMWAAVLWSVFGTVLLAGVGSRLPGLEFQNQLVEAAYRKELVYGEDDASKASESVCRRLFADVRKNYYTIFVNFMYFNVAKYSYLQFDVIFPYLLLVPSIAAGSFSMGQVTQTVNAFGSVSGSFQFLVMSWKTIVELMSIFKRLQAFEKGRDGLLKEGSESDGCSSSSDDPGV